MSPHSLDVDLTTFRDWLAQASDLVIDQFTDLEKRKAYHHYPQATVASWFDEEVPEQGMPIEAVLADVQRKVMEPATGNLGPHMYGYVVAGGTQVSILAELLAATINQNVAKWHLAPTSTEVEKRVVQWVKTMLGYPGQGGGVMVSGGSAANLAGLTVARNVFYEHLGIRRKGLFGQAPFTVYASEEVHSCVDKSMDMLGLGTDHLRRIATNEDFTINIELLKEQIAADKTAGFQPFCIIGNAGTVNTGAIDNLSALADIATANDMWFHVDGAYGGIVGCVPELRPLYVGIERANSVALDFHKWLYQPFEVGCLLVNDWSTLRQAYFKKAAYLATDLETEQNRIDFNEHYFQLSRSDKSLKTWMSIKTYGMERIRAMITKDIDLTKYLVKRIEEAADFELTGTGPLAAVCFRYTGQFTDNQDITTLNERIVPALEADGRVFLPGTRLNGTFALRACIINHRKDESNIDYLLTVIREIGQKILES